MPPHCDVEKLSQLGPTFLERFLATLQRDGVDRAWSLVAAAEVPPILDRKNKRERISGALPPVNVLALIERFTDDLHAAREAGEVIVSVSLTLPEWNHELARKLAPDFGDRLLSLGARGLLMAIDVRKKTGEFHWHGVAIIPEEPSRKEALEAVSRAWQHVSSASPECIKITTISGWNAFVASEGDFEAMAGLKSFRTNLSTVLGYSFHDWPVEHGVRDLATDVFAIGCFSSWNELSTAAPQATAAVAEAVDETVAVEPNTLAPTKERNSSASDAPQRLRGDEKGVGVGMVAQDENRMTLEVKGVGTFLNLASRRAPPRLPATGVPRYPGVSVLTPAVIPSPPLLDPKRGPVAWATTLAMLYRNVIALDFGAAHPEARFAFMRGEVTASKHFKLLEVAARFMIENEIRPAEWCAYSCRSWRGVGKPPPVAWIFGTKGLATHLERFKREMADGVGNRFGRFGLKVHALFEHYGKMRRDLVDLECPTKDDVHRVVELYFPDGHYDRMLEEARKEIEEEQAAINARVAQGDLTLWFAPSRKSFAAVAVPASDA